MRMQVDSWPCSEGQGSGIAMSCGIGHRRCSDQALLQLWCRPAATALIRPLAWEPPCAVGAALKKTKDKKIKIHVLIEQALITQL